MKTNFLKTENILSSNNWIDQLDLPKAIQLIIRNQSKSLIAIKKLLMKLKTVLII